MKKGASSATASEVSATTATVAGPCRAHELFERLPLQVLAGATNSSARALSFIEGKTVVVHLCEGLLDQTAVGCRGVPSRRDIPFAAPGCEISGGLSQHRVDENLTLACLSRV